jgi:DNA (cytosine-5)-methyltransferase 1
MKFYDAFCGIGGFHQALSQFGHTCVGACDIDAKCRDVYFTNYTIHPESDITNIKEFPDFDILCGGFPCQPISSGGKKLGLSDPRGKLFDELIRIAILKEPMYLILENVKHIKKIDNGKVFQYIHERIDHAGYTLQTFDISPHHLGIPQNRERVIFVCVRKDLPFEKKILKLEKKTVPIFEKDVDERYMLSEDQRKVLEAWDEMIRVFEESETISPTILCKEFYNTYTESSFKQLPQWKQEYILKNKRVYVKYKDQWDQWFTKHQKLLSKREIYNQLDWQAGKIKQNDSIFNYFIQFRQSGIRVKTANYFPTLVAIVQTPVYGKEKRFITPRECARLQSFPDSFVLHKDDRVAYKQLGNSVNVEVIKTVSKLFI